MAVFTCVVVFISGCEPLPQPRDPALKDDIAWESIATAAPSADGLTAKAGPALHWDTSRSAALTRARTEKRKLLVWVHADWSTASKQLARNVWSDAGILRLLEPWVLLQLDVSLVDAGAADAITAGLGIDSVPTVLVLDASGNERLRMVEPLDIEKVRAALRQVELLP